MTNLLPSVWLAEGQSSQRDMLASLQHLKSHYPDAPFTLIASHRYDRPEIFTFADVCFTEPSDTHNLISTDMTLSRWRFVLDNCRANNTQVLLTGRNSSDYEAHRLDFEAAGIRLLTGATNVDMLHKIEDKFEFIQHCQVHNIPVATGWRFDNLAQLKELLTKHGEQPLCVKPVTGIFAQGFWRLDTGRHLDAQYDSFTHLYYTNDRKINWQQFISAYTNSNLIQDKPIPMLLMPYLTGQEYSIDVVCEQGEVLAAVTRYKAGKIQHIGYDKSVMAVVIPLIKAFGCDGIVSVQTKQDSKGVHRVLEINSRPSGGIGYTMHSKVDLTQVGIGYWLGLTDRPKLSQVTANIAPCKVRSIQTSVKIA